MGRGRIERKGQEVPAGTDATDRSNHPGAVVGLIVRRLHEEAGREINVREYNEV